MNKKMSIDRRTLLTAGGVLVGGAVMGTRIQPATARTPEGTAGHHGGRSRRDGSQPDDSHLSSEKPVLSFKKDGSFTIVQFNDTQDDHLTDRRTIEFMNRVLDQEKPDFSLINGDVIAEGPQNNQQVYQALNNVVLPMESRKIPWAVTWGNHDEDPMRKSGTSTTKTTMIDVLRQYRYNMNGPAHKGISGKSNDYLTIAHSQSANDPAFGIWLLDSGSYASEQDDVFAGQSTKDQMAYDWIHPDQIAWYQELSRETEHRAGHRVPSLMFFHIPLYEHHNMWYDQQFSSDEKGHSGARKNHNIDGVKHEKCYTGLFNSGIYAAVLDRGDVLGIYCGHDHINSYKGNYYGVELGYCPGSGFGPYGLEDGTWKMHTLRGARVFQLDENTTSLYRKTYVVNAQKLGLDMDPQPQKLSEPLKIPDYVRLPDER